MLSLPRIATFPDIPGMIMQRTAEECGRSAAQTGSAWCERPDPEPSGGRSIAARACSGRLSEKRQKLPRFPAIHRAFLHAGRLTVSAAEDYITPSWARRRLARWCVCEAPHLHTVTEHPAIDLMAMFASPRRMCGFRVVLTSESEEKRNVDGRSPCGPLSRSGKPVSRNRLRKRLRRSTF